MNAPQTTLLEEVWKTARHREFTLTIRKANLVKNAEFSARRVIEKSMGNGLTVRAQRKNDDTKEITRGKFAVA